MAFLPISATKGRSRVTDPRPSALLSPQQIADHSVFVVGELKSSLVDATKGFKDVVKQRADNVSLVLWGGVLWRPSAQRAVCLADR